MTNPSKLIGQAIRDLRKQQALTGAELGRRVGMSQSKISKLEAGIYPTLHFNQVERILNILKAPDSLRQQIYSALGSAAPSELKYRPHDVTYTKDCYERELKTRQIKTFSPFVVPALLQTNEYRIALLKSWGIAEQDTEIIRANARRQDLLWDTDHQFHFIMHQAMLYSGPVGRKGVGLAQIDRLERFMSLPNIQIGIIPLEVGMPTVEFGPFALLDEKMLVTATIDGDLNSKNSKHIAIYGRIFTDLSHLAVYGEEAKRLTRVAIDFLGM